MFLCICEWYIQNPESKMVLFRFWLITEYHPQERLYNQATLSFNLWGRQQWIYKNIIRTFNKLQLHIWLEKLMHIIIPIFFGVFSICNSLLICICPSMGLSMSLHKCQYYIGSKNINSRHFYPKNGESIFSKYS